MICGFFARDVVVRTVLPETPQQRRQEQEAAAVVFRNRRHVSQDDPVGSNFEAITLAGPSGSVRSIDCLYA